MPIPNCVERASAQMRCIRVQEKRKIYLQRPMDQASMVKILTRRIGLSHLCKPRKDDHCSCYTFFFVPENIGRCSQLRICHCVIDSGTDSYRLLRSRVGHPPAIMWRICPPHDSEKERPGCREHMVDEEKMGEIKCLLRVFLFVGKAHGHLNFGPKKKSTDLFNCFEAPSECDEAEERIEVEA